MGQGRNFTTVLVGLGFAAGLVPKALAQPAAGEGDHFQRNRNTSVAERRKTREDEEGMRLGSFRVKPEFDLLAGYTDNFAAAEVNPESSTVVEGEARLALESDWGRHALNLTLAVPTTNYLSHYSVTDYVANLDGRLDVDRGMSIDWGAGYGDRAEPLGFTDPGVTLRRPLRYDATSAYVGVNKTFNRLRLAARAGWEELDYREARLIDGTPVSFDERDVSTINYELRADFAVSDTTALFVSAGANERDHDLDPPDVAVNQDSQGNQYLVGINFDISNVMRGELAAGSLSQSFDDPAREDQNGLAARGQVEWFPDELVTVTLGVERAVQNSYTVDASTVVATNVNLGVDYEFRRDIALGLSAGYSDDEYDEIDRDDSRWNVYVTAAYEINRSASLELSAGHIEQTSDGVDAGRNYDANVAMIGIRLHR